MIIVKIFNQQLVQVAAIGHQQPTRHLVSALLACKNSKQLNGLLVRSLVQSSAQSQKITNSNNQQLIPVARNISFRECQHPDRRDGATRRSAKASFSSSTSNPQAHVISASGLETYGLAPLFEERPEWPRDSSPLEALKRHAKDSKARREQTSAANRSRYYGQSFNEAMATTATGETSERSLVVLLSWLQAKEKHIEKYRQFYMDRGFDVLNVKTSPLDMLLPNWGANKISEDFLRFMMEKRYSNVVVHGFSVGGYMFGRFLLEIDKHSPKVRDQLLGSIRGLVFDSLVPFEGTCPGVARSITSSPLGAKVLESAMRIYLRLAKNIATKHYLEASDKVWGGPLRCPTLFLMSRDDKISDHKIVERLASVWANLGVDCRSMIVDSSPHVQIYSKHHDRYVEQVDDFLRHIKAPPKPMADNQS